MVQIAYAANLRDFFAATLRQTNRMVYMAVRAAAAKMARPGRWVPICSWNQNTRGVPSSPYIRNIKLVSKIELKM